MAECSRCKRPIRLDECNMTSECYMAGSIHCLIAEVSYRRGLADGALSPGVVETIRSTLVHNVNRLRNGTRRRFLKDNRHLFAYEYAVSEFNAAYPPKPDDVDAALEEATR